MYSACPFDRAGLLRASVLRTSLRIPHAVCHGLFLFQFTRIFKELAQSSFIIISGKRLEASLRFNKVPVRGTGYRIAIKIF
jgi:hypothetical protein